jgi:hypothetical protein
MVVTRPLCAAAVVAPPVVWVLTQQAMGELVYVACRAGGPPLGPAVAVLGLLLCAAAAWVGWKARAEQPFLARLAVGSGALFALGCLALVVASLTVPPCAR